MYSFIVLRDINDVENIVKELLEVVEDTKDSNNTLDVYPLLKLWSLEK